MSDSQIVGSTFDDGLRAPHYLDRRLLSAGDLKADQQTMLARLALLGQAVGAGVVAGLAVEPIGSDTIRVQPGLGFNSRGNPVRLPRLTTLSLRPQPASSAPLNDAGRFHECTASVGSGPGGVPVQGAYLLTAAPVSRLEGSAPVKAAAGSTTTPACAAQWEVEGLQFQAIRLSGFSKETGITTTNRRNRLAHWCFGSADLPRLQRDPFSFGANFGGLAQLGSALTPCDLPLAVFFWNGSALEFVDMWAARRANGQSSALTSLGGSLSQSRETTGQARLLQFQEQLAALQAQNLPAPVSAASHFPLLPAAGFLPMRFSANTLAPWVAVLVQELVAEMAQQANLPIVGIPISAIVLQLAGPITNLTVQLTLTANQSGLFPEQFFGKIPLRYMLADHDQIDAALQRSLRRQALVVAGVPAVEIWLAEADLLRMIGPSLIQAVTQVTVASPAAPFVGQFVALTQQKLRQQSATRRDQLLDEATPTSQGLVGLFLNPEGTPTPLQGRD